MINCIRAKVTVHDSYKHVLVETSESNFTVNIYNYTYPLSVHSAIALSESLTKVLKFAEEQHES